MQFRPIFSVLAVTIILTAPLLTTGCSNVHHTHGQIIPQENLAMLEVGKNDKQDVRRFLGSPSTVASFNDDEWLYITTKTVDKPLSPGNLVDREILVINFDENGKIAQINKKDASESRTIVPSAKTTETQGQSMGIVDQMLDNLGQGFRN